jgi:hypothetical protein
MSGLSAQIASAAWSSLSPARSSVQVGDEQASSGPALRLALVVDGAGVGVGVGCGAEHL